MDSSKKTPNELKENGNRLFALGRYKEAIACYTSAIEKSPRVSKFYSNRAICHIKLKDWDRSVEDSRRAIELDGRSVKGHFFLGMALTELQRFDEAVMHLSKAHDQAREQGLNFGDDIAAEVRRAKRSKFDQQERRRLAQEIELQTYLNDLIEADRRRRRAEVENSKSAEAGAAAGATADPQTASELAAIDQHCTDMTARLADLLATVDDRRRKRDVPEVLCGKISFDLMRDPVISPSGITYDRRDIEDHLHRVGHFDPITRKPLTVEQLVPNLAMKEVVSTFLETNPWAEDF
ncbi:hypothetical protein BOX15_Mlig008553g14 [Macrostomum lignano]|uniref:Uncharacterized protein n=2 Tax=Macrostomum lignano TaxID=282301 RepID=A0A267FMP9_9PLAT|nr:hypothetical protein BOX15_Mlig032102g1 [Macrostomum lignano]PAA74319.1 hypothetical protein BOX15_Mlig008553g14 [Macrostomum lignano]